MSVSSLPISGSSISDSTPPGTLYIYTAELEDIVIDPAIVARVKYPYTVGPGRGHAGLTPSFEPATPDQLEPQYSFDDWWKFLDDLNKPRIYDVEIGIADLEISGYHIRQFRSVNRYIPRSFYRQNTITIQTGEILDRQQLEDELLVTDQLSVGSWKEDTGKSKVYSVEIPVETPKRSQSAGIQAEIVLNNHFVDQARKEDQLLFDSDFQDELLEIYDEIY